MATIHHDIYNCLQNGHVHRALDELDALPLRNCFKKIGEIAAKRPDGVQFFARFSEVLP